MLLMFAAVLAFLCGLVIANGSSAFEFVLPGVEAAGTADSTSDGSFLLSGGTITNYILGKISGTGEIEWATKAERPG